MRTSVAKVVSRYLQAAPLDDYHSMPSSNKPATVGWGLEKRKASLHKLTTYFESRKDSWAIIIQPGEVEFADVEAYVRATPKLRRSKIIVMVSDAMGDDFSTPKWVIHDIIGHGISMHDAHNEPEGDTIPMCLHAALPKEYRINKGSTEDLWPDIYAAIFFHADLRELIEKAAELEIKKIYRGDEHFLSNILEKYRRVVLRLANNVAHWTSDFEPGVPQMVETW